MTTLEQIVKARRDLEKRLLIDIRQFEKDTGVLVRSAELRHVQVVGERTEPLLAVELTLEFPR